MEERVMVDIVYCPCKLLICCIKFVCLLARHYLFPEVYDHTFPFSRIMNCTQYMCKHVVWEKKSNTLIDEKKKEIAQRREFVIKSDIKVIGCLVFDKGWWVKSYKARPLLMD